MPPPELTVEQRRALQLLADAPNGYTESALRGRGFTPTLLVGLLASGYAIAKPQTEGRRQNIRVYAVRDNRLRSARSDEGMATPVSLVVSIR